MVEIDEIVLNDTPFNVLVIRELTKIDDVINELPLIVDTPILEP
jgi:hypothetical protein